MNHETFFLLTRLYVRPLLDCTTFALYLYKSNFEFPTFDTEKVVLLGRRLKKLTDSDPSIEISPEL